MSEVSTGAQDEDPMVRDVTQWLADNPATPEPAGDLVERVADAIAKADRVPPDEPDIYWAHLAPPDEPDIYWAHLARAAIDAMPDRAALVASLEATAEAAATHLKTAMELRTQLASSQADVARLREGVADMANQMKIVGSHYNQAQEALDGIVADVKSRARAILKEKTP